MLIFFFNDTATTEIYTIDIVVKEHVHADQVGPLFKTDLVAPTEPEMANALTVAATARAQLAELYNEVPPAQRSCALKPGEWSLVEHLQHVIKAEAHYVSRLNDQPAEVLLPANEAELPRTLIENGMNHDTFLRELTPERSAQVYSHGEALWTAAKVLRRMTEHVRDHYPSMQAIARQFSTPRT